MNLLSGALHMGRNLNEGEWWAKHVGVWRKDVLSQGKNLGKG